MITAPTVHSPGAFSDKDSAGAVMPEGVEAETDANTDAEAKELVLPEPITSRLAAI